MHWAALPPVHIEFAVWHPQVYCQCLDVQSRTSLRRVLPGLVTWATQPGAPFQLPSDLDGGELNPLLFYISFGFEP